MKSHFYLILFFVATVTSTTQTYWSTVCAEQVGLSPLYIKSQSGLHFLWVEMATTMTERQRGLMYRSSLGANHGMLFDYGLEQPISMWMRNTAIPLDMVFINMNGRVSYMFEETVPFTDTLIPSKQPAQAVLELNAGSVKLYEIQVGDLILHPIFNDNQ